MTHPTTITAAPDFVATAEAFLGVPYVTVSAHSRHLQQSCRLESTPGRQSYQRDLEWARG